jgi:RNA polymerase sigma-70 factor (ECF subfamily)
MHLVSAAVLEKWQALSDEQIVAQFLDGHTALFEVLMRRHDERVYRAARAIVRDEREAEDVMQQAYVNAYAHLRQFDDRATARSSRSARSRGSARRRPPIASA